MENELKTQRICRMIGCYHPVENPDNGLCAGHNRAQRKAAAPKAKPARRRIAKQSEEGKERMAVYNGIREMYLRSNQYCRFEKHVEVGCEAPYDIDIHHRRGRLSDLLYDVRYWLPVCRKCHQYIETHPEEAYERGWSLSRHQTETI